MKKRPGRTDQTLWFLALMCFVLLQLSRAENTQTLTAHGITISMIGNIAISPSSRKINIILKHKISLSNSGTPCDQNSLLSRELMHFTDKSNTLIHKLKEPLNLPPQTYTAPHRNKRQLIAAILGGSLLSGIGFAASEVQIHALKRHLQATDEETNLIIKRLNAFKYSMNTFAESTIGIMREMQGKLTKAFEETECNITFLNNRILVDQYIAKLSKYIDMAAQGQLHSKLGHDIIDYNTLQSIVAQHQSFEGSIFRNNPTYLYGLSTITVIDILVNDGIIHLIMEFPIIPTNSIFPLHEVNQIGLHIKTGQCLNFNTPSSFFTENGISITIPLNENCIRHSDLTVCRTFKHLLKPSCINEQSLNCSHSIHACTSPYNIIYTPNGLLTRDNSENTFYTEMSGKIRKLSFTNHSTTLIPWKNVQTIFIAQELLVENPGDNFASMTEIHEYNTSIYSFKLFPIDALNITNAYKSYYDTTGLSPLDTLHTINRNKRFTSIIIALATIIIGTLVVILLKQIICPIFRRRRRTPINVLQQTPLLDFKMLPQQHYSQQRRTSI